MASQLRFDDKVVIITGAGNGLGRQHALMFGARGAKVVVNDLGGGIHGADGQSTRAADKVVEEIKTLGGQAVANYDSVEFGDKIVKTALDAFGTVDIVVNNAGILRDVSFQKMTKEDWDIIVKVHLTGSFSVSHAAWPIMRDKGYGRIVMTTSAAGIYGNFGQANYSAAKLGIYGLANTLAIEGRNKNIHVNTIAPIAASRLTETVMPPELLAALKPEYVSPLVGWLAHESCKETGGLFEVGAGYFSKLRWERTKGLTIPLGRTFGPDEVAAKFDKVTDFTGAEHPLVLAETIAAITPNLNSKSLGGNQFIDLDAASADKIEIGSSYDERDLALYALGAGAARDPLDAKELPFVYELGDSFQALPTYGVMPAMNAFLALGKEGKTLKGLNYGLDRVLHGEQYLEIMRPLPRSAKLRHTFKLKTAYDKAPNAVVILGVDTVDENGEKLAYNEISVFVRGAGGWGGDRGPSGESNVPPSREPDAVIEEKTDPNQTLLYRLSGDWNPLHADPAFAKAFGFDKPILHGLCTFGFVGRHVIKAFCNNDGRRFKSIKVRFAESVFPGETLVTRMWKESDQRIVVETRVKERDKVVIKNAAVELYDRIPEVKAKPAAKAPAGGAATEAAGPSSADLFAVIGKHLEKNPGLGDQVKTVFQFKLKDPESSWVLDLRSGNGSVKAGAAEKPDVTLELSDENFILMSTGKADPNKLYFGGKLKVTGNVMASQKLAFLQKIDPKLLAEVQKAPVPKAAAAAPAAPKSGKAPAVFAALLEKLSSDAKAAGELAGQVVQFNVKDPDISYVVDLSGKSPKVEKGTHARAAAVFGVADEDLVALVKGEAKAGELYQRGKLRVDGDVRLAKQLGVLSKLI